MHPFLIFELLVLVAVANAMPVVTKKLLREGFAWPVDGGVVLADGLPLLGSSKTIRGIVAALVVTPLASALMGLGWELGALVALAAMAGDLFSSFVKRRLGLQPSSMSIGLDQVPESLLPLIAAGLMLPLTVLDVAVGTAIFFAASLVASRLLFKMRVRDEPY